MTGILNHQQGCLLLPPRGGLLHLLLRGALLAPLAFGWMPTTFNHLNHAAPVAAAPSSSKKTTQLTAEQGDDDTLDRKYSGYNVLGTELSCCCSNVGNTGIGTGFYR